MEENKDINESTMWKMNVKSVAKKLTEGTFIILLVGIGAFAVLLVLMSLI